MVSAIDMYLLPPFPEDGGPVSPLCHAAAGDREKHLHFHARSDLSIFSNRLRHYLFTKVTEAQTSIPLRQVCHGSDDLWEEVEQAAGDSYYFGAQSTSCQRSSELATVHTSGGY